MKKRRLITLILASMAIGALASCGGGGNDSSANPSNPSTTSQDTSTTSEEGTSVTSQEELPAEYSLMKFWGGNPSEEFYEVNDTGNNTVITYTDLTGEESGGWAYVARPFAYDAAKIARFGEYKKFSFTAKLQKTSGSDIVLVKAEGSAVFEKRIQITETEQTFEFSTAFISDWPGMTSLLFFANRNIKEAGNGVLTLTRFVLSKEEVNPDYDISGSMPDVPQDWNYYNGEEKLDVMYSWGYNVQGEIATEKVGDTFKFTWGGDVQKTESYGYVSAKIKDSGTEKTMKTSEFKRIVFKVQGTAGQEAILKFEARILPVTVKAANELKIELTGEVQEVEVDISKVVINADAEAYFPLIMPAPGKTGTIPAGELILSDCYLDKTAIVIPEETNDPYYPVIWMDKVAKADPCYAVYRDEHMLTVQYDKAALGYESFLIKVSETSEWYATGDEAKNYNRVVGIIKADVNVKVLLKPFDSYENWLDLKAGVAQEVDFTVDKAIVDLTKPFVVFIAAGDGEQSLKGTVTFEGLRLARETVNIGYAGDIRLTKVHSHNAQYTMSHNADGDLVADFNFDKADYHTIEMYVSGEDNAKYNQVLGTVTSTVDTTLLLKPADKSANEKAIALTANTPVELSELYTVAMDYNWSKFVMFVSTNEGDGLQGTITFKDFYLHINDPEYVPNDPNPVGLAAVYLDNWTNVSNCYSLKRTANGTKVIFGAKGEGWENMQASLNKLEGWFNLKDYTRVTATLKSTVNLHVIIKPYDNGAYEKHIDLVANTETKVDYTIDLSGASDGDLAKNLIFFVGTAGCEAGELLINNLCMSNPKTNLDNGEGKIYIGGVFFAADGIFSVTPNQDGKGIKVDYTKAAGQEWEGIQIYMGSRNLADMKVLHLKGTSQKAVHVKFKIDGTNLEQNAVFEAGVELEATLTFSGGIDAKWNKVLIFIAYEGGDDLTGSINFSELYFAKE